MSNKSNFKAYSNGLCSFTIENKQYTGKDAWLTRGWGNGYIGVQELHPLFGVDYQDTGLYTNEELTIAYRDNINGVPYWIFGFDTCHSWNNLIRDTEQVVLDTVDAYVKLISDYTNIPSDTFTKDETSYTAMLKLAFEAGRAKTNFEYTFKDYEDFVDLCNGH